MAQLCRENLRFYRRNLKFTVPNLLPAEKFLFKFRLLTQSKEIAELEGTRVVAHVTYVLSTGANRAA